MNSIKQNLIEYKEIKQTGLGKYNGYGCRIDLALNYMQTDENRFGMYLGFKKIYD